MTQEQENNLQKNLEKLISKTVTIKQDGFLKSKYSMQKFEFNITFEILNITDENSTNYLNINLNQIYKTEINEESITLYLDNDTIKYIVNNKQLYFKKNSKNKM